MGVESPFVTCRSVRVAKLPRRLLLHERELLAKQHDASITTKTQGRIGTYLGWQVVNSVIKD